MYSKTGDKYAQEDLLRDILMSGVSDGFPYPGYFKEQVSEYLAAAEEKGGDHWIRVKDNFQFFI